MEYFCSFSLFQYQRCWLDSNPQTLDGEVNVLQLCYKGANLMVLLPYNQTWYYINLLYHRYIMELFCFLSLSPSASGGSWIPIQNLRMMKQVVYLYPSWYQTYWHLFQTTKLAGFEPLYLRIMWKATIVLQQYNWVSTCKSLSYPNVSILLTRNGIFLFFFSLPVPAMLVGI